MQTDTKQLYYQKYSFTIFLLCLGYFIDFYDLTIFSASYSDIIKELFHITDIAQIQLLYLKINNFYTSGIILGGILFGVLGDKYGRIMAIRYSILLYSIAVIASTYTTSIPLFIILRILTGMGLAAEFATSSVLISELLPVQLVARATSWLYCCGILGGITATCLSQISWQVMFLFGGFAGLVLYFARKKLFESPLLLDLKLHTPKGVVWKLFSSKAQCLKMLKLLLIIVPFYFLISSMFILPNFMPIKQSLDKLVHILLFGFFIGNLISTLCSSYIVNKFRDYRIYFIINSILFGFALSLFMLVHQQLFFAYAIVLGLIGGGLPTLWIQMVAKSYGVNQRSTASNVLNVLGRGSGIGFNLLISVWLAYPQYFNYWCIINTLVIMSLSITAIATTANNYAQKMDFLE